MDCRHEQGTQRTAYAVAPSDAELQRQLEGFLHHFCVLELQKPFPSPNGLRQPGTGLFAKIEFASETISFKATSSFRLFDLISFSSLTINAFLACRQTYWCRGGCEGVGEMREACLVCVCVCVCLCVCRDGGQGLRAHRMWV